MPSAVSVPVQAPTFTLTFGGVDFRLDPNSSNDSAAQVSFQTNDDGVFVNLQSFTGTLRVSSSSLPPANPVTKAQPNISSATAVEEEPVSPANNATPMTTNAAGAGRPGVSPTQKQLPFVKAKPAAVTAVKKVYFKSIAFYLSSLLALHSLVLYCCSRLPTCRPKLHHLCRSSLIKRRKRVRINGRFWRFKPIQFLLQ